MHAFTCSTLPECTRNVDALYAVGRLTADKTFRETVVSAAAKAEAPAAAAPASSAAPRSPLATAREARSDLDKIGMPMGWLEDVKNSDGTTSPLTAVQMCKADPVPVCAGSGYSWCDSARQRSLGSWKCRPK